MSLYKQLIVVLYAVNITSDITFTATSQQFVTKLSWGDSNDFIFKLNVD